jgi:hypothetical protein
MSRGHWSKSWCAVALPLLLAVESWAAQAHAGSRVLLLEFGGRKADVLREQVVKSLEQAGNTVVLSERTSEGLSSAELSRLAKRSDADAVVDGLIRRHSMRRWSLTLRVHDADGGVKVGQDVRFQNSWLPGLAKELTDRAAARLGKSLARAKNSKRSRAAQEVWNADDDSVSAAAVEEPASAELESESAQVPGAEDESSDNLFEVDPGVISDEKSSESRAGDAHIVGAISTRAGLVHRSFDFSDDIYDRLRKQNANIWVYQLQAEVFPFEQPVAERLGVVARYEGVFSGNVRDSDFGGNFPVVHSELFAGLRARYPLGGNQVGFDLTFGRMRSGLDDPQHQAKIPEVTYTLLRTSLDVSLDLGRVRVVGVAGFRLPLGYGEISRDEWFPRVGGYGVEVSGGLEYPMSKAVSLELSASLRRYLLEMNSEPEDAITGVSEVAGGAVDLYTAGYFGMNFRL